MISTILFITIFMIFGLLVIFNSYYRKNKIVAGLKIDYLNRTLNDDNISNYMPVSSYSMSNVMPNPFPLIIQKNMKNTTYKLIVDEFQKIKKNTRLINIVLLPLLIILIIILLYFYPDFVVEIINNPEPE
ncbi:MAG: hypothetical protein AAGG59_00630 [Bacteroidota bacterium]